jgi:outer membrane protein insertion porin family
VSCKDPAVLPLGFLLSRTTIIRTTFIYFRLYIVIGILGYTAASGGVPGTAIDQNAGDAANQRVEIQSIGISTDGEISPSSIRAEMRTTETPTHLSIFFYEHVWERMGSPRSLFDPVMFDRDIGRLREYFQEHGYFHAQIDTSLNLTSATTMNIEIRVKENVRSLVDTVKILGLEFVDPAIAEDITSNCLLKHGTPYASDLLVQEQTRTLRIFHNGGYPDAEIVAIFPVRYLSTNNISVTLHYLPGRRYVFGSVTIAGDTIEVDPNVVHRQLDFAPGEVFNEEKKTRSEQNLNRIGLLENAILKPLPRIDSATPPAIPIQVMYRVMELKEITPEVEINNENGPLNTGIGLGYSHRNFFGNASTFSVNIRARLQEPQKLDLDGLFTNGIKEPTLLAKTEIVPQIYFPYFYGNQTSANVSLSLEGEKQPLYTLTAVRGKFVITNKFATYTTGYADWTLERVDPTILSPKDTVLAYLTGTREKQFNSILTLTLQRDKTDNIFSPTSGFFHSISFEESGTLPRILGNLATLPFSEYVKLSGLMRQYYSLNSVNTNIIAIKLKGGMAYLYNEPKNETPLPLTRRFFAGGSGSIRGWNFRSLTTLNPSQIGGDLLLETSVENRVQLFRNWGKFYFVDLEALWGVVFVDAGNLWDSPNDIKLREFAIAGGIGLRYETFIGPIRFDVGVRVYDPNEAAGKEWVFSKSLFRDSYSVFHFGLGHAF